MWKLAVSYATCSEISNFTTRVPGRAIKPGKTARAEISLELHRSCKNLLLSCDM
jgi:hypothetical protein